MTRIRRGIALADIRAGSGLYRDFALKRATPAHAALGEFRAASPDWRRVAASKAVVDGGLAERMLAYNRDLGARDGVLAGLEALRHGAARAVVTGQQPGVAGGPLMTLYKIATAVSLAREIESRQGIPCVPVFWMGADDDDFAEIRELAAVSRDSALISVSLAAGSSVPGRRVGDIAAAAVRDAWNTMAPLLPPQYGVAADVDRWMQPAQDLGEAAARCIMALCGGGVAVIDGREPLLRECTRDLLLGFFDREEEMRERVVRAGAALGAAGYHAQLDVGESSGLFLVEDGVRRRVPAAQRAVARARFAADIRVVSPGVVARNLMQDAALKPVAVVLGPAEIAYRAQLAGVYDALAVARPVVFPRMSATFVPPPVADLMQAAELDPASLVLGVDGLADAARARLRDEHFGASAQAAQAAFDALARRFADSAAGRLDPRAREKLEKRLADIAQRLRQALSGAVEQDSTSAAARFPFLPNLAELFARAGAPQERYLSMTVPYAFHGAAAWDGVRAEADGFSAAALDDGVVHRVYSL